MLGVINLNCTNISILNLLYRGKFSQSDLALYLDIDDKSISKNILQLNVELEDLGLNKVELKKGRYYLNLTKDKWRALLGSKESMSPEDIVDYLYIKFIYKGFINLEQEKSEFQLSRSTISRYFTNVKNILNENKSIYKVEVSKGMKLLELSEEDKRIFCKKLIKVIVKLDFCLTSSVVYKELFKNFKVDDILHRLYNIFILEKIHITKLIMAFSLVLKICVDKFGGFSFCQKIDDDILKNRVERELSECSKEYKNQLSLFLINLKNNHSFLEEKIIEKAKLFTRELKKELKVETIESEVEQLLRRKIDISIFKYENKILNVCSYKLTVEDEKILSLVRRVLKKIDLDIYFYDKITIVNVIKKILIESNKRKINKILLLFNETILPNDTYLIANLKKQISHIKVDIKSIFYLQLNYEECCKKYDLVVSDEDMKESVVQKISTFSYLKILEKIEEISLKKAILKLDII